ncbi:MAG: DUF1207 domain-containing protein [Chlamydiales bacterium]|nr:DUF1207 domain-containing protein [Chlamydiales bacterium]
MGAPLFATCCDCSPLSRADNIPIDHVSGVDDDYMTGYIQALVDMSYYEFQVRVICYKGVVYVFNLPCNQLISSSIVCYIHDVPCVECVRPVCCSPEEFVCYMQEMDSECAHGIAETSAYQSICTVPPCCQTQGIWLPQNVMLFQPLIADPRQVINSAALRFNDDVVGKHVGAVSFGNDFMFYRWLNVWRWQGDMDIGIQAGIFSVFDLDHPTACMVNTDFFVAFMMTYAVNKWSWRFRIWHISSHLGDEFLISNPGYDRRNLSDEAVDLFVSYQMAKSVRLYLGVGDIFLRDKEFPEHPLYFEWGAEIRCFGCRDRFNRLYAQPVLAMNFWCWENNGWSVTQTYVWGMEWSKLQGVGQKLRLLFEFHDGHSKEGQFVTTESNYVALKMQYGY